jgi:HEAT repeat protein
MNSMKIKDAAKPNREHTGVEPDPRRVEKVRAIFMSLSKFINAKAIYAGNNPIVMKFGDAFHQALRAFFQDEKELRLAVDTYRLTWRGETVYDNPEKKESLAFLLYKDGVGELIFQSTVKDSELEQFVDLIKNEIASGSPQCDIVSRLWQAEFADITYRVFDECADGKPGEGEGSACESGERQLRLNDHPNLLDDDRGGRGNSTMLARSPESLGAHLLAVVEREHPGAGTREKELRLQHMLESLFAVHADDLTKWRQSFATLKSRNKLLWLLHAMLDFTRTDNPAPIALDVLEIINRLIRSIAEEADIPTLRALLETQRTMASAGEPAAGFESLPQRIRHELTNTEFLIGLGKRVDRSSEYAREIMGYFRSVGNNAVPALREILSTSNDSSIHAEACEALLSIARDYIMPIIEDLKPDNPLEALDAIYLLRRSATGEVPAFIERFVSSPEPRVRVGAAEYLAEIGTDDAAELLCGLLADQDKDVRLGSLAAAEKLRNPCIVAKVTAICFEEDLSAKEIDELERLFRTAGKLGGTDILPRLKRMATSRGLFPTRGGRARQNKLLAITALRFIQGQESHEMLEKLAGDGDKLVRSKAQHALNQHDVDGDAGAPEPASAASSGGES